jgi:hypothetical protein
MKKLIVLCLVFLSFQVHAATLMGPYKVRRVITEDPNSAGFYPVEPLDQNECKYGLFYFTLNNESGKAMLALLLSAKAADQRVVRVDYVRNATVGTCHIIGLHVE